MEIDLEAVIAEAMALRGVETKKELCKITGLPYPKVRPALAGDKQTRFVYVETILLTLGYQLKAVKI